MNHQSRYGVGKRMTRGAAVLGTLALGAALALTGCGGGSGGLNLGGGGNGGNGGGVGGDALIVSQSNIASRDAYYLSGDLYTFLAKSSETNNAFNAFEFLAPPGGGPRPHVHGHEAEIFYVVNGVFDLNLDGHEVTAGPGAFLYGAQGHEHGFMNPGKHTARLLSITVPAGLQDFFAAAGTRVTNRNAPIPPSTPEEFQRILQLAAARGDFPIFPGDPYPEPPGALDRVLVVPPDALTTGLNGIQGLKSYAYGQRSPFSGPSGIQGTNLLSYAETANTIAYDRVSLPVGHTSPAATTTTEHILLYVLLGKLNLTVNGHASVVNPFSLVYIKPGQSYALSNGGDRAVDMLFIQIHGPA